jgi:hypothetical protein
MAAAYVRWTLHATQHSYEPKVVKHALRGLPRDVRTHPQLATDLSRCSWCRSGDTWTVALHKECAERSAAHLAAAQAELAAEDAADAQA